MEYNDAIEFLYNQLPMFQRVGGTAYKAGLETSIKLNKIFNEPYKSYHTIHIAGTNGKGSVSHLLAATLQLSGYKVGLYTSPHLIDFRERIKVNGEMISKEAVMKFIDSYLSNSESDTVKPSFFELTMTMAFDYFRQQKVDVAVIEVGLGGRLDSTNIINPDLCVITNISFDHTQFLGTTLAEIASEKAGIIKHDIPVLIGESTDETRPVFLNKAQKEGACITFAEDNNKILAYSRSEHYLKFDTSDFGILRGELSGDCQIRNANTVLNSISILRGLNYKIGNDAVINAFAEVCELTGLMGRWMTVNNKPRCICDTGHNVGGIKYIVNQLKSEKYDKLHIIIGFVNDKDVTHIMEMLPTNATYYFTQAQIPRALSCEKVQNIAQKYNLVGEKYNTVIEAYNVALKASKIDDLIFIGGSTFIVADLLIGLKSGKNAINL
ncbi:MAG: Mur ligase family protein [Muribaculaceae bacterium]|nr:Mur ligase family protein [Muribaculaceae bacterium]